MNKEKRKALESKIKRIQKLLDIYKDAPYSYYKYLRRLESDLERLNLNDQRKNADS